MRRWIVALQLVLLMVLNIAAAPRVDVDAEPTLLAASADGPTEHEEAPSDPVDEREAESEETGDDAEHGVLFESHLAPPATGRRLAHAEAMTHSDHHLTPPVRPPRTL